MALTTLVKVKRMLRIPTAVTDYDDLINDLIEGVDAVMLGDVGGGLAAWASTSYVKYYDVQRLGLAGLLLVPWPVLGITELKTGTNGGADGSAVADADFSWNRTGLVRLTGAGVYWPFGEEQVKVTFNAGIESGSKDELALTLAQTITVVDVYKNSAGSGLRSEKIGNYSYVRETREERGDQFYPSLAASIMSRFQQAFVRDQVVP